MSFNERSAALSSVTLRSLSPSSARLLASSADLAVARSAPDRASRSREMSRLLSSRRFAFCVLTLLSSTPTPLGVLSASSLSLRGAFAFAWDASVRFAALAFSFWVVDMGVARVVASAGVFMDEADAAGVLPRLGFMRVDAFGFDAFSSLETPNMRDFLPLALGDGVAYSPLLLTSRSGERTFMVVGRKLLDLTIGSSLHATMEETTVADVPSSIVPWCRRSEGGSDADGGMYVQSRALDMCDERVTGGR